MADKDITKETLRHYIELEYYANGVDEEMQALLNELGDDCGEIILSRDSYPTKDLYNMAYRAVKERTDEFRKKFSERMEEEAEKVSGIERDFLKGLYGAALAVGAVSVSKLMMSNIGNKDSVSDIPQKIAGNVLKAYSAPLRSGYIFGTPSSEIKASADRSMKNVSREMQSGIRTAVPAFARQTDSIVFMKNSLEVVWCATLDGRTCLACGELHGKKFPSIAAAPSIPLHYNCRCVALLSSAAGKSMPTYKEFIDSLDDKEQREVLGKTRYEMYKSGAVTLERFVNNGSVVPVSELKKAALVSSGARSKIIEILKSDDIFKIQKAADSYYENIRNSDNKEFISKIAENSGKPYNDIEKIISHIFKEKHKFIDGRFERFYPDPQIIAALERIRTKEHTDTDILLLNHELSELTYMRNKKYNIYEIAHKMANEKFDWEEAVNENVQKNK